MTTLVLARNEWIKTTRRVAFWVTLGCLGAISGITFLERRANGFSLPGGWQEIVGETGPLPGMFAAIAIIMLVASEFSWRTGRQNVIDGLSREQFFAGKVLMLPAVAISAALVVVGIGAGIALAGTDLSAAGSLLRSTDLALLGGQLLSVAGLCALGLLAAILVRSSGAAIALFFLYVGFGERILAGLMVRVWPAAAAIASYRPSELFFSLTSPENYYGSIQERAVAAAVENGRPVPTFMEPDLMAAVAGGWIAVFLVAGFLAFRRRDL